MPETSEVCNQTDKGGIQNLPKGFALNGSKVVYEGYVEAPTNSFYQFILYYAGYMKIYIDGKLVVPERWRTAWNPNSYKFETPIKKGVKTPIRIEWQPDGDVSYCGLRVAAPRSEAEKNQLSIWSEMSPDMDYYFIAGQNLDEVISGYRTLTGKASLYPKWTLGFWQSRERYQSSKDIEDNMKKFRDLHIPVDNIVQDWNYWKLDSWGSHEFEAARYPNPQAMLDSVHAMNGKFMISVWPKFYDTVKTIRNSTARVGCIIRLSRMIFTTGSASAVHSMMPILLVPARCSGARWTRIFIPSISSESMHGGWMHQNQTFATVPRCGTARLFPVLLPSVHLPNISMLTAS